MKLPLLTIFMVLIGHIASSQDSTYIQLHDKFLITSLVQAEYKDGIHHVLARNESYGVVAAVQGSEVIWQANTRLPTSNYIGSLVSNNLNYAFFNSLDVNIIQVVAIDNEGKGVKNSILRLPVPPKGELLKCFIQDEQLYSVSFQKKNLLVQLHQYDMLNDNWANRAEFTIDKKAKKEFKGWVATGKTDGEEPVDFDGNDQWVLNQEGFYLLLSTDNYKRPFLLYGQEFATGRTLNHIIADTHVGTEKASYSLVNNKLVKVSIPYTVNFSLKKPKSLTVEVYDLASNARLQKALVWQPEELPNENFFNSYDENSSIEKKAEGGSALLYYSLEGAFGAKVEHVQGENYEITVGSFEPTIINSYYYMPVYMPPPPVVTGFGPAALATPQQAVFHPIKVDYNKQAYGVFNLNLDSGKLSSTINSTTLNQQVRDLKLQDHMPDKVESAFAWHIEDTVYFAYKLPKGERLIIRTFILQNK
jgi:hypothetical protein